MRAALVLLILVCSACAAPGGDVAGLVPKGSARPYSAHLPRGHNAGTWPVILDLPGYSRDAATQSHYFALDDEPAIILNAEGAFDQVGKHYWNANDSLADYYHVGGPDDVAYLRSVLDDASVRFSVDPKRIYCVGHSTGDAMCRRLACDVADRIAAVAGLAGTDWQDQTRCRPSEGVAVLHAHGTADTTIAIDGGATAEGTYPSARDALVAWAARNGCDPMHTDTSAGPLDLDDGVAGAETTIERWTGCSRGVELWRMVGSVHLPTLRQSDWADALWDWLAAHPKP